MSDGANQTPERDDVNWDEDDIDIEIRSSVEVRTRILILGAILRRLAIESAPLDGQTESIADAFDEREWLREQGLSRDLTPAEAALLDNSIGSIPAEAIVETSWQGEAFATLCWAIRTLDMPPVGIVFDPGPVIDNVPRPWDDVHGWLDDPTIATEAEVVREREIAEIWYWRVRTEVLRRSSSPAEGQEYEDAIQDVAFEALDAGLIPTLHERDFPVKGGSIRELSENEIDELVAITSQRLRALNWLCGFGASWDDVPLDV
jgi:hypothetical protein